MRLNAGRKIFWIVLFIVMTGSILQVSLNKKKSNKLHLSEKNQESAEYQDSQHLSSSSELGLPATPQETSRVSSIGMPDVYKEYFELSSKVLSTDSERERKERVLLSESALSYAVDTLLEIRNDSLDFSEEEARLAAIKFLSEGLTLKNSQAEKTVADRVVQVLLEQRIKPGMKYGLKKSLAGDQIELFQQLAETYPDKAEDVLDQSKGTQNEKIYLYAMKILSKE